MQKLVTGVAASAALAFLISTGFACDFHDMSTAGASTAPVAVVAMSTQAPPPIVMDEAAQPAALRGCPADAKDCVPTDK